MQYNPSKYNTLTITNTTYGQKALKQLCNEKLSLPETEEWERTLYQFILEWLDAKPFVYVKTSGSTGKPKIIEVSKSAMLRSAFNTIDFFKLTAGQSALLCLSCHYIAGKMMVVRAFAGQLNLVPVPVSGHPLAHLSGEVDFAALTPLQMSNELDAHPDKTALLKTIILGGSATGEELSEKLQNLTSEVWETYGMTETLSHIALRAVNGKRKEAHFTPLKNVLLSIDPRGCLIINAQGITDSPVTTNDLAGIRSDGKFRIRGRYDNVINTGGIKVSPEEIESNIAAILNQPFFVSSVPHAKLGQQLVLVVEKHPEDAAKLLEMIKEALPRYHAPKKIIVMNPLPRTDNGKIKRTNIN
jgi:O-succinylbenzoic acid--CoA ligase